MSAEIIDLSLMTQAHRCLGRLLEKRGITYFMSPNSQRPFSLEPARVDLVLRAALRLRPRRYSVPLPEAVDSCRRQVRRVLIRRMAELMLQVGF